jgi:hypothetical protein
MSTAASPSIRLEVQQVRTEKITPEQRLLLSHALSNLCALGLVKRVIDGIGVVRYQLTDRRMA